LLYPYFHPYSSRFGLGQLQPVLLLCPSRLEYFRDDQRVRVTLTLSAELPVRSRNGGIGMLPWGGPSGEYVADEEPGRFFRWPEGGHVPREIVKRGDLVAAQARARRIVVAAFHVGHTKLGTEIDAWVQLKPGQYLQGALVRRFAGTGYTPSRWTRHLRGSKPRHLGHGLSRASYSGTSDEVRSYCFHPLAGGYSAGLRRHCVGSLLTSLMFSKRLRKVIAVMAGTAYLLCYSAGIVHGAKPEPRAAESLHPPCHEPADKADSNSSSDCIGKCLASAPACGDLAIPDWNATFVIGMVDVVPPPISAVVPWRSPILQIRPPPHAILHCCLRN
jgi:hypothetical protein